jgi:hypothetical protein
VRMERSVRPGQGCLIHFDSLLRVDFLTESRTSVAEIRRYLSGILKNLDNELWYFTNLSHPAQVGIRSKFKEGFCRSGIPIVPRDCPGL